MRDGFIPRHGNRPGQTTGPRNRSCCCRTHQTLPSPFIQRPVEFLLWPSKPSSFDVLLTNRIQSPQSQIDFVCWVGMAENVLCIRKTVRLCPSPLSFLPAEEVTCANLKQHHCFHGVNNNTVVTIMATRKSAMVSRQGASRKPKFMSSIAGSSDAPSGLFLNRRFIHLFSNWKATSTMVKS